MGIDMVYRCPKCKSVMLRTEVCKKDYACICPFCEASNRHVLCDRFGIGIETMNAVAEFGCWSKRVDKEGVPKTETGGDEMGGYTVRAVAVHGNRQDVVSDDKVANMFDVHMGCGDGNREWVASFRNREEATVFCTFMERQGSVGEWRDRVMREAANGKNTH